MPSFRNPSDAWHYALGQIEHYGNNIITEDGQLIRELLNLSLTIKYPLEGYPVKGSGWDIAALDLYAEQLMNPENTGFDYTYGNRLRAHECIFDDPEDCLSVIEWDQIEIIIGKLKRQPTSRRCVAITWYPDIDIVAEHSPCLIMLDFLIRQDKLYTTAIFRSHDIGRAYIANIYGLGKLQKYIADQLGIESGDLTTISISAHYYIV
jgi:thymidylate synthase